MKAEWDQARFTSLVWWLDQGSYSSFLTNLLTVLFYIFTTCNMHYTTCIKTIQTRGNTKEYIFWQLYFLEHDFILSYFWNFMWAARWDCVSQVLPKVQKASKNALEQLNDHLEHSLRQIQATQMTLGPFWTRQKKVWKSFGLQIKIWQLENLFLLKESNISMSLWNGCVLDNNKGFINLYFLQKMNWMKTEWDQARFSNLVWRLDQGSYSNFLTNS